MTEQTKPKRNLSTGFAQAAIPLLKEYTTKLDVLTEKLQRLRQESKRGGHGGFLETSQLALRDTFLGMEPAMEDLARRVSQRIEHGVLDDFARLELRLRLAEFESTMQSTRNLLMQPFP